ncbi:MAG: hypothetical protein H8E72_06605 [Candidatus Marinimicrobia bacterium]|nr:hypothetical protein [Candidatus Neomarinimicrobiota bacterium]
MNKTILGSILTAFGASLCCTGPLILMAFGVTSVGIFSFIEPLRPYLTIIALSVLSYSFYKVFRKQPDCCESDKLKMKSQKISLFIMTPVILGFLAFPNFISTPENKEFTSINKQHEKISEWSITGMTCQGCANGLEGAMSKIMGMSKCSVIYESQSMICQTDPQTISENEIKELVTQVGYKAIKKKSL